MRTLSDSELSVSIYPTFEYNSSGGGGVATASADGSRINLLFDPKAVTIPEVSMRTATILGLPMLPGMRIEVEPAKLEVGSWFSMNPFLHSPPVCPLFLAV